MCDPDLVPREPGDAACVAHGEARWGLSGLSDGSRPATLAAVVRGPTFPD